MKKSVLYNVGDAVVIIQSDPGASGVVTVLPSYRFVTIAEPDGEYDGTSDVM